MRNPSTDFDKLILQARRPSCADDPHWSGGEVLQHVGCPTRNVHDVVPRQQYALPLAKDGKFPL